MEQQGRGQAGAGQHIAFARTLRGVAALSVVWLHLGVGFWFGKGYSYGVIGLAGSPASTAPWWAEASRLLQTLGSTRAWFDFGAFGVALFFLVSGFLIPMSVVRHGPLGFLVGRVLRIHPVYLVSLSLWLMVRLGLALAGFRDASPDWAWPRLLAQGLLVSSLAGYERVDPVSWTLEIELIFYVAVVLMAPQIRLHRLRGVAVLLTLVAVVAVLLHLAAPQDRAWHALFSRTTTVDRMQTSMAFVCYVFAGYVFHLRWLGRLGWPAAIAWLAAIQSVACVAFLLYPIDAGVLLTLTLNQVLAMAVFGVLMARFPNARHPLLDRLSAISFPLYTTHLIVGFTTLALLDRLGLPDAVCLALAACAVLAVATLVHRGVERPSQVLSGRVGRWLRGARARRDAARTGPPA